MADYYNTGHFLDVNGIRFPVFRDDLQETVREVGDDPIDGAMGIVMATRVAKLRRWRFKTPPLAGLVHTAYAGLIEAYGASWKFASGSKISDQGFTNTVAGSFTAAGAGGPVTGGKISVSSGSVFGSDMRYRMGVQRRAGWSPALDGWTLSCQRKYLAGEAAAAGWHHCALTGVKDFVRGSAANPTGVTQYVDGVVGSHDLGHSFSVSLTNPFVGLHGYKTANTAATIEYADVAFYPFAIPASLLTAWGPTFNMVSALGLYPTLPRLFLTGQFLGNAGEYAFAIGRVRGGKQMIGKAKGETSLDINKRELEIELLETLEP